MIDLGKETKVEPKADVVILTSKDPTAIDSLQHPDAVRPVTETLSNASSAFSVAVPPNALMIITLRTK